MNNDQQKGDVMLNGITSSTEVLFSDIFGYIQTLASAPTFTPSNVYDQIKIVGTKLYVWNSSTQTWNAYTPSSGGLSGFQVFTSSGTFTTPAGFTKFNVEVVGGGANGGNANSTSVGQTSVGAGGGAGAYSRKLVDLTGVGTVTVTINGIGGSSVFGSYITANGASGQSGGTATGGDVNISGGSGESGMAFSQGGSNLAARGGKGAVSFFGEGGQAVVANTSQTNGNAGAAYGSGGSGAASANGGTSATGGAGVSGLVLISW